MRSTALRQSVLRVFLCLCAVFVLTGGASSFEYDGVDWHTFQIGDTWYMASIRGTLQVQPGMVTVSFDTTLAYTEVASIIGAVEDVSVIRSDRASWYDLRFPEEDDPSDYVSAFDTLEGVLDAVPAFLVECDATPDDDYFSDLWGLENTGQSGGTSDADVDASAAWDSETGDTTVVIAVIDTGADLDHSDLLASLWIDWDEYFGDPGVNDDPASEDTLPDDIYGYDFYDDDGDPNHLPIDGVWHGSHVAGVALAKTNNDTGVAGLAGGWGVARSTGARLMTLRIGKATLLNMALVSDAIYYAVDNGADIINMSFHSLNAIPGLRPASEYTWNHGVLMVAASGNDLNDILDPARRPRILAVGATDHDDDVPSYSTAGDELNLVAPGGTNGDPTGIYSTIGNNQYGWKSGTSMSAPLVCGAAALAISADPTLSLTELWRVLEFSTDDEAGSAEAGWESDYGWGRLNADVLLDAIEYAANSGYTYGSATCKVFCPAADANSFVITVTVRDENEDPVEGVPSSAIWAESKTTAFKLCCVEEDGPDCIIEYRDRVFADASTNSSGEATITLEAAGGSGKQTPIRVMLYGLEIPGEGLLELIPFRSYDIDADCDVDSGDFTIFNSIMGTRDSRGDFDCDGDVDSADSLLLAAHDGDGCPARGRPHRKPTRDERISLSMMSWPNPFNPSTEIECSVPAGPVPVDLGMYNAAGRRVRTLFHGEHAGGLLRVTWDGADDAGRRLASGVYFCRAVAGTTYEVRKLILLK